MPVRIAGSVHFLFTAVQFRHMTVGTRFGVPVLVLRIVLEMQSGR